jgi:hypothetical protein
MPSSTIFLFAFAGLFLLASSEYSEHHLWTREGDRESCSGSPDVIQVASMLFCEEVTNCTQNEDGSFSKILCTNTSEFPRDKYHGEASYNDTVCTTLAFASMVLQSSLENDGTEFCFDDMATKFVCDDADAASTGFADDDDDDHTVTETTCPSCNFTQTGCDKTTTKDAVCLILENDPNYKSQLMSFSCKKDKDDDDWKIIVIVVAVVVGVLLIAGGAFVGYKYSTSASSKGYEAY